MAVAFVNKNTALHSASASVSGNQTVSAGSSLCAFVSVAWDTAAGLSVSAISYNGTSILANSCGTAVFSTNAYVQWFYYINPPVGTATLAVTIAGGSVADVYAGLVVFSGVNQTTPVRPTTYTTSTTVSGDNCSITVSSNASDMTVSALSSNSGSSATNQTAMDSDTTGTNSRFSDRCTTPGSSVTHTWSGQTGTPTSLAGFSIQVASAGGSRGLFMQPPMNGLGTGGSFFANPIT